MVLALMTTDGIEAKLKEFSATHGNRTFDEVLPELMAWIKGEEARQETADAVRRKQPVYAEFHRIVDKNGRELRYWWPRAAEATIKAWVRKKYPELGSQDYTIEYRRDIYQEGELQWFRGKSCGEKPDERFGW